MENRIKSPCKHLRSKNIMVPDFSNAGEDYSIDPSVQHYWCLCTMTTAGPDNKLAVPEDCQTNRSCFEAEDE
ncbi:MAG: hypothetical protein DWQ05_20750 [Calditrichaeota bacterium]|nr:MAG: hypothetical protein DWQ05_20750 [Calditrichota bacterium]